MSTSQKKKIDIEHYLRLVKKNKFPILAITIFVGFLWYFISPILLNKAQEHTFTSIIRFDDPRNRSQIGSIDDRFTQIETESRIEIFKTTSLITTAIDSLKLNLVLYTIQYSREEVFQNINLKKLELGVYGIKKENDKLVLFSIDKEKNQIPIQNVGIHSDFVSFNTNSMMFDVSSKIFEETEEIRFGIIPNKQLVEKIKSNTYLRLNRWSTKPKI